MSHSQIAAVLGRLPSGLLVLTSRRGDADAGMLVSWVMQAGFEPPMVTVALHKDRPLAKWLADGLPFALNLLAENQRRLVSHFGRHADDGHAAFAGLKLHRTEAGIPVLDGTIGYLECQCEPGDRLESGDRRIFLARVLAGRSDAGEEPLVHVRKNGMRY